MQKPLAFAQRMWYPILVNTAYGRVAQLVVHLLDVQEVIGSSPIPSTTKIPAQSSRYFLRGGIDAFSDFAPAPI